MALLDRYLYIRIVSAAPEDILNKLIFSGVNLSDIRYVDPLTMDVKVQSRQYTLLKQVLKKNGTSCKILKRSGFLWHVQDVYRRPVLAAGVLLFALLACLLPGRIFFVRVSGNESTPDRQILLQAEACGIRFGSKAADVRSEKIKNQLLDEMPELQWVGVNTSGCVATIYVQERSDAQDPQLPGRGVSSIIAAHDGVITQMTVQKGNPLFQTGQAVKKGDVLVSGYTDCGLKVQAEHAQAEVMGYTIRKNVFLTLPPAVNRGRLIREHSCYRLHIGKKVINLCNHSGISDGTCVKMYSEYYWTLPGNFRLPVSVVKVEHKFYEQLNEQDCSEDVYSWLPLYAQEYLKKHMVAGEILTEDIRWRVSGDCVQMLGSYACHEMIGQEKYEEIAEHNAEDN